MREEAEAGDDMVTPSNSPSVQSASGEGTSVAGYDLRNSQNLTGFEGVAPPGAGQKMTAEERASFDDGGVATQPNSSDQRVAMASKANNFDVNSSARGASAIEMASAGDGNGSGTCSRETPAKRTSRKAADALKERAAAHSHGKQANERGRAARQKAVGSTSTRENREANNSVNCTSMTTPSGLNSGFFAKLEAAKAKKKQSHL